MGINENLKKENEDIQEIALNKYNEIKQIYSNSVISTYNKFSEKKSDINKDDVTSSVFKRKN